jgi:hypothetical protein
MAEDLDGPSLTEKTKMELSMPSARTVFGRLPQYCWNRNWLNWRMSMFATEISSTVLTGIVP